MIYFWPKYHAIPGISQYGITRHNSVLCIYRYINVGRGCIQCSAGCGAAKSDRASRISASHQRRCPELSPAHQVHILPRSNAKLAVRPYAPRGGAHAIEAAGIQVAGRFAAAVLDPRFEDRTAPPVDSDVIARTLPIAEELSAPSPGWRGRARASSSL